MIATLAGFGLVLNVRMVQVHELMEDRRKAGRAG